MNTIFSVFILLKVVFCMNEKLIVDFLELNHLKISTILTCNCNSHEDFKLFSSIQRKNIWVNVIDLTCTDGIDKVTKNFQLKNQNPEALIININCNTIEDILSLGFRNPIFYQGYHWLMFGSDLQKSKIILMKQNINVDAEVSLVLPEQSGTTYKVFEVWNPSFARNGTLQTEFMGYWNISNGFYNMNRKSKSQRRNNFGGVNFKAVITVLNIQPNRTFREHLESNDNTHLDTMSRMSYKIMKLIEEIYNCNFFLERTDNWGIKINNNWTGAVGFISRNEVDLCVTPLRQAIERFGVYDLISHIYLARIQFIFRHPRDNLHTSVIYVRPFDKGVWICIGFLGFLISILLYCISKTHTWNLSISNFESTWSNCSLTSLRILFQQGFEGTTCILSARIVLIFLLIYGIVLYQFYSAFIVGSLLIESPKAIRTSKQLLKSNLKYGSINLGYSREILEHVTDKYIRKLYLTKMLETKKDYDLYDGMNLIKRGDFAFHLDVSSAYPVLSKILTDDEICDLQEVKYDSPKVAAPASPKLSPLKDYFAQAIDWMRECGILNYHSIRWQRAMPRCPIDNNKIVLPVDLNHFSSAIYVLLFGMVLSVFTLVAEFIYFQLNI